MSITETNEWRKMYETLYAGVNTEYTIDTNQISKHRRLFDFLSSLAYKQNGIVSACLKPSYIAGGITAKFTVLHLEGEELKTLCELLSEASSISFDVEKPDKVCISVNIPDVYKCKDCTE